MPQGEKEVKHRILYLASDQEIHRQAYFIQRTNASKNTIKKYLNELTNKDHLIDRVPGRGVIYRINDQGTTEVETMKLTDSLEDQMRRMSDLGRWETVVRFQLILDILRLQDDTWKQIDQAIAQTYDTLKGDELKNRLSEINQGIIEYAKQIIKTATDHGIKGAEEKEKRFNELLSFWNQFETELASPGSLIEKTELLLRYLRDLHMKTAEADRKRG